MEPEGLPNECKRTLQSLPSLRIPPERVEEWRRDGSQPLRSLVNTATHCYYLYPSYLATAGPPAENSVALLCRRCARITHKADARHNIPAISLAKGFDFGSLVRCGLPELSLLEMMLVRRVMPYGHIVKLVDGESHFALAGHLVAIATDSAERIADAAVARRVLPRRDAGEFLSVVFVGSLDRWQRLMSFAPNDPRQLMNSYGQICRDTAVATSTWRRMTFSDQKLE